MPSSGGERLCSAGFMRRYSALSEGSEEGEDRVVGSESRRYLARRHEVLQSLLLGGQICLDVSMSGLQSLVAKPESNDGDVHAGLKQMHCTRMSQQVRMNSLADQAGTFDGGTANSGLK
jgi:hypothetical protein